MATCVISATVPKVVPAGKETSWDDSQRSLVQRAQRGDEQAFADLFPGTIPNAALSNARSAATSKLLLISFKCIRSACIRCV